MITHKKKYGKFKRDENFAANDDYDDGESVSLK